MVSAHKTLSINFLNKGALTMDIKAKIEEIVKKVKDDKDFASNFAKDPVKAVEGVIGIDLPDDQINAVITAVKAKVGVDDLAGLAGKLGGILGKK